MYVENKTSQFEIVVKWLACLNTQFKIKESFKLLIAIKVKNTNWVINHETFCQQKQL